MVLILENASSCSSPARSACWAITTKVPCSIRKVFIRGRSGPSIGPAPHWENSHGDPRQAHRRWDFLGELPRQYQEGDFLFVHGSARNPLNEYVFPEDIYNRRKMEKIFALVPKYAFQRHTHVPGVFTEDLRFLSPEDINYEYRLGVQKLMINVGSVGQPRDGDPRACYVIIDGDTIRFRRVEYPWEQTIQKIYAIPQLDNFLGDRLREGRGTAFLSPALKTLSCRVK